MIDLTTATSKDIPLIKQLGQQAFYPTYLPFTSEQQVDYMFHKMYDESTLMEQMNVRGDVFLIASENGMPKGFASYQIDASPLQTKLHKLYILPNTQTKGLGKCLLQAAENNARIAGQESLLINVNRYNKAVDFYKHMGYSIYRVDDIDIGKGYFMNDYEMIKSLT
ncbi:MAG: GNAT family N-acetyltransferase [Phycisphaerales bacterium]|nr:GNAT family N-acetyltransferase [Phycisphaerales bacterium]